MDRMPNEIRLGIVRQLRDENDRKALVAAFPTWNKIVEHADKLRVVTIDESRCYGVSVEDFLASFEGTGLRRRQFLDEVRVERFVDTAAYYEACCTITAEKHLGDYLLAHTLRTLMEAIDSITKRSVNAGLKTPAITLSLQAGVNDLKGWKSCSGNHTDRQVLRSLARTQDETFEPHNEIDRFKCKGVDEFRFKSQGLFQRTDITKLGALIKKLVGLRVLRLDFKEESFWSHSQKALWQQVMINTISGLNRRLPLEEIHVHAGRYSPRNELECIDNAAQHGFSFTPLMIEFLSAFSSLTVLRLSGQFCVPVRFFDRFNFPSGGFRSLTTFYLGIQPNTDSLSWFFVKDTTEHAWTAAARDPKWAETVALTRAGLLPQDILPGPEDTDGSKFYKTFHKVPAKRNRTLPYNGRLGPLLLGAAQAAQRMPRIEAFSICLEDDFSDDDSPYPFTPPFLTRVFEMHFALSPSGGGNATLTWKLGQKVDYWRPARICLDAWREVARKRRGVELDIKYIE
ncbi:hypothetical protein F5144DRAFT_547469 [Chaetomium tenue]|uniref:Uncharacterized protein n=1 Tax=Chaetomium tenue TaxID=1854479 RepID=A0ACB7P9W8_9PEZI|nr:hypothetical protein F5144DRAFT_547469 [Chaetomium globosum]